MAAQVWEENAQEGRLFQSKFYAVPKMGHSQIQSGPRASIGASTAAGG
jgi:hypothetical protein